MVELGLGRNITHEIVTAVALIALIAPQEPDEALIASFSTSNRTRD